MMDIAITPDGDLKLGNQLTNEDNDLLFYVNNKPESVGIIVSVPNENSIPIRDMDVVYSDDSSLQLISNRFRTDETDWYLYPELGASISELAGELNSRETAEKGKNMIINSLIKDSAFNESDIEIIPIPISLNEILYDIRIKSYENVFRYTYLLDLEIGVLNYYEVEE